MPLLHGKDASESIPIIAFARQTLLAPTSSFPAISHNIFSGGSPMRFHWPLCILALIAVAAPASAQETIAKSKIVSVGLFKNGLAVVKREVLIPKEGTFR